MLRIRVAVMLGIGLLAAGRVSLAQSNQTAMPAGLGPVWSLEQFGAVASPADAEKTYQQASRAIKAAGGGVILIPTNAAAGWKPANSTQEEWRLPEPPAPAKNWGAGPGVTVVDARGTMKIQPPQVTGIEMNRVLNMPKGQSLPFWDYFPMLKMRNSVLNGSTSYRDWLQEDAPPGKDSKFYVATIRGIFPGMFMSIGEYGVVERLYVKSLGYDKEKHQWYFVADTVAGQRKGTIMGNKNHVNVLDLMTESHNENQTFDVRMWRFNYSQGDNYLFDARFKYMGDVHSTAGDENGVLYAAFVEALTDVFKGQVERWDPETGELKFKGADAGRTLGTGRPMINLNPAKWITNGSVAIVRPASWIEDDPTLSNPVYHGKSYPTTIEKNNVGIPSLNMGGLIRFSAAAPVSADAIGRYFAVDEKDEYIPTIHGQGSAGNRRWYLIDAVKSNPDGTKDIRIVRHWWGAKSAASPTLYKPESYSWDGHEKPLHYIIAPGANVYDVSEGVENPKRTVRLVPTSFAGTAVDFAAGDKIEQAMGPDPFKPVPFRSWMWDVVPGVFPSPVFDIGNAGHVQRDSVLKVHWGSPDLAKEKATRYDRSPSWDKLLDFETACNTGIKFAADTADAAILFAQPYLLQPIHWNYGFTSNEPPKTASLTVSRDTGEFSLAGTGLRVQGPITVTGLSADAKPARNLRGKNVAVKAGDAAVTVTFPVEEADGEYAVFVEQNWLGNRAITKKTAKGFTIQFEKPAPADAQLDWMIVR